MQHCYAVHRAVCGLTNLDFIVTVSSALSNTPRSHTTSVQQMLYHSYDKKVLSLPAGIASPKYVTDLPALPSIDEHLSTAHAPRRQGATVLVPALKTSACMIRPAGRCMRTCMGKARLFHDKHALRKPIVLLFIFESDTP